MPFLAHLAILRKHVIVSLLALAVAAIVAYSLYDLILDILYKPLEGLEEDTIGNLLYINTFFEGFLTRIKISVFAGFVLSFPVHLLNALLFVFPGLKPKEKRVIVIALIFSFVFIVFSFLYSYYKIIPISLEFLTGDSFVPEKTGMLLGFSGNIIIILQFMLVALIVFQIPIILEVLLAANVLNRKVLWRAGRYVTVFFFILAAVVTPPDFITQLSLAVPLTGMYFLTLLVAKIFGFGSK